MTRFFASRRPAPPAASRPAAPTFNFQLSTLLLIFALSLLALAAPPSHAVLVWVSAGDHGQQGDGDCPSSFLSGNGRYVFFVSSSDNLIPGDTNGALDVFRRDLVTGALQRVSLDSTGQQIVGGNCTLGGVTPDGRYVAINSNVSLETGTATGSSRWYVKDLSNGTVSLLFDKYAFPFALRFSADARYALFASGLDGLVPTDQNGLMDVFVLDRQTQSVDWVSVGMDGAASDGSSWYSDAGWASARTVSSLLSPPAPPTSSPTVRPTSNVYLRDRQADATMLVSATSAGAPSAGASYARISPDGRYVIFSSSDPTIVPGVTSGVANVFLWDHIAGTTERVSLGTAGEDPNGDCQALAVSAGGRYVLFGSYAGNLAPGCTPIQPGNASYLFLRDRQLHTTTLLSVDLQGQPAADLFIFAEPPQVSMSDDGQFVLFGAEWVQGDLVPVQSGSSGSADIVLWDPAARFYDLPSQEWAFSAIEACVEAGIVGGYPEGTYHPLEVVTRAQMAVFIARALAGGDAKVPAGPATAHFPDVPTSHWAYKYIQYAYADNIVAGYADGYEPNTNVTRDQMAVFIARSIVTPTGDAGLTSYTPPTKATFADVSTSFWAFKYIEYCHAQGIVNGYPDGYEPGTKVTRDQMAVFVQRAFKLPT